MDKYNTSEMAENGAMFTGLKICLIFVYCEISNIFAESTNLLPVMT